MAIRSRKAPIFILLSHVLRTPSEHAHKANGTQRERIRRLASGASNRFHARKNESGERFTYSEIMEKTPQEANAIYASIVAHMAGVDIDPKPKSPKKKSSGAN